MLQRIFILVAAAASLAVAKTNAPPLEQMRVHFAYKEGEFDVVTSELENYASKYQGRKWLREDSVFLYKHLAVVYTASQNTREKGKYYMIAMLRIMPSAEILDMYVSEEVDRIFLRTREEFLANMKMFGVDTASLKIPTSHPVSKTGPLPTPETRPKTANSKKSKSTSGWWWAAGGLTVAAAGAATYFVMMNEEPADEINVIPVPKQ